MFGKKSNAPSNHFDTLISSNAVVVGDVHFSGGLHVDGKIYGNIIAEDDSKAILRISDKGAIEGEVSVPHVVANGSIVGDVHACEHLELAAKAQVCGNVFYNTIEIMMGAQVDGRMSHRYKAEKGEEKPKMPKQVTREKPQSALLGRDALGRDQKIEASPKQKLAAPTATNAPSSLGHHTHSLDKKAPEREPEKKEPEKKNG